MSRPRSISCGRSIRSCRKPDAMLPPCHRSRYVPGTTMPARTRARPRRGVGRETLTARRLRVRRIVARLEQAYHDATCALRRKTASVVLGTWFRKNEGIVVDTHVQRLSTLLGLTRETDPVKIERDLMGLVPRDQWTWFSHTLILHGRRVCIARRPRCEICVINRWCPSSLV